MTIEDYKALILQNNFEEFPFLFIHDRNHLSDILIYKELDPDLKIYLAQLILCRSFYGTYTAWSKDVDWFINGFFKEYKVDFIKPEITEAIREAAKMILSDEIFTKKIIATTFMFGILEFYAKYKPGFRPYEYNFADKKNKDYIKKLNPPVKQNDLTIKSAFGYLQKENLSVSAALNDIDSFTTKRLSEEYIQESVRKGIKYKIADRLALARNPMLHGERHSFYDKGEYLLMLYILLHLHDSKKA